jgi:hypothetical protein
MPNTRAVVEPKEFPVYEQVDFMVRVMPGKTLTADDQVACQLPNSFSNDQVSPSKVKEWQNEMPDGAHFAQVTTTAEAQLTLEIVPREYVGGFQVNTRHGRCFIVTISSGSIAPGDQVVFHFRNTTSPWLANQNPGATDHEGVVLVLINGEPIEDLPTYEVLPGPTAYQRVIVPSFAKPDEPFRVLLVSLDKYSNRSASHFEDVDITCNGQVLREGLSYTGSCAVTVSLPKEGLYRLEANDVISNPIRIHPTKRGPYWGDIHFHNYPSVDAMGNTPYAYARDVSGLDFAATAEHGAIGLPEHWAQTQEWCQAWNEPGRFVTILAIETNVNWHHNIYFYQDHAPMAEPLENGSSRMTPTEFTGYISDKKVLTQIHHTGWGYDMRKRYPDTTKLIEVFSMHGQSELYDPDSPLAMKICRHRWDGREGPYYVRDALALGQRFGIHGSSDNHFGQAGVHYNSATGVMASALEREAILDTLRARHCYATTGERVLLDLGINGQPMGSEFEAAEGDMLRFELEVHGTGELEAVELFACPFIEGNRDVPVDNLMFEEDDPQVELARGAWRTVYEATDIGQLDFRHMWEAPYQGKPLVYYVRVRQAEPIRIPCKLEGADWHQVRPVMAWSSPIWVLPG